MIDVLLLQPPPGDLTGPYPALPYLKSFVEQAGFQASVRDLGIEALYYLSGGDRFLELLQRADKKRQELEGLPFLNTDQQSRFGLLVSVMGLGLAPDLLAESLNIFRDGRRFYDYELYKKACQYLNAFYRLLSAVHYPTEITPSEYPRARMLGPFENIMAHQNRDLNPYVDFYQQVLFPQVAAAAPRVIGLSMVFGSQSVQTLVLGRLLKERFPKIHVTLGGAYLSQWILLMKKPQLARLFTCADSVICGEGEEPLALLLESLRKQEAWDGLPNLVHPAAGGDEFRFFSELTYTDITRQPPPDFSDLDLKSYLVPRPVIPYSISRGCYWGKCVFCQNRYGDRRMRQYQTVPVDKAIEEMSALAERYQTDHFNFSNDVIDPAYLEKFSRALLAAGKKLVWNTDLRAEKAFNQDLCRLMAQAGLNSVAIGFESGCDRVLRAMDKGITSHDALEVMTNLYSAGVATQAMGIFGFPGESLEDGENTVLFLEENLDHISYYVMGLLMVLPGSRMYERPEEYQISSISFADNPMRTPEPVWRSRARMPFSAVNDLYERLSRLERVYALNEYPYVGALSTNHSFLFFEQGPDILKRLKWEERQRHLGLHRLLGVDAGHELTGKLKKGVPHLAAPFLIYHSPFPLDRIQTDAPRPNYLQAEPGNSYLIDVSDRIIPLPGDGLKLLKRIDGRRNLKTVLNKLKDADQKTLVFTLLQLFQRGLIAIENP